MNDLEKRSFHSFLGLYILSSFLFIAVIGYWYYTAQKRALVNETHYRLEHIADKISGEIIFAHMQHRPKVLLPLPKDMSLALIDTKGEVVEGGLVRDTPKHTGYYKKGTYDILVSDAPRDHLNIRYVVVQTDTLSKQIDALAKRVLTVMFAAAAVIALIAWILSKLFMRPVHERVVRIERFINDITHELNTPISSLSMATQQALKKGSCTPKTLKNISISTRQLYDIYRSLTYLNFSTQAPKSDVIDLETVLLESVAYYRPLAETKQIDFIIETEPTKYAIAKTEAILLFGNLISNAVKYSSRKSTIHITLKERVLRIKDEGIGIDPSKHKEIFEKFNRGTAYAGGFGVGLSIVKRIAQDYRIRVEVDSAPQEGSLFVLYFP